MAIDKAKLAAIKPLASKPAKVGSKVQLFAKEDATLLSEATGREAKSLGIGEFSRSQTGNLSEDGRFLRTPRTAADRPMQLADYIICKALAAIAPDDGVFTVAYPYVKGVWDGSVTFSQKPDTKMSGLREECRFKRATSSRKKSS